MRFQILLPTGVLIYESASKVTAEAEDGGFCLKPRHVDMVTALSPGIVTWTSDGGVERFAGVAEGVLVKSGRDVRVSVQFGVCGSSLAELRNAVRRHFEEADERERQALSAVAHLESDFVRRYRELERRTRV